MNLIYNAEVVLPGQEAPLLGYVAFNNGRITATGCGQPPVALLEQASECTDAGRRILMPGAIDCHVHFREPGLTHKATMATESRAAAAGGITSWIDMPNTQPPTVSLEAWEEKNRIAEATAVGNHAFFIGATASNLSLLQSLPFDRVPGVKLFMGQSTGNMAVGEESKIEAIFAETEAPIVVHAEDDSIIARNLSQLKREFGDELPVSLHSRLRSAEACVRASERAMELAARYGSRLHLAHISTAAECALLDSGDSDKRITAEVSPHHLWWCDSDYARLGARIKMNPAIKSAADREVLRQSLLNGRLDMVATDHAPHLPADKEGNLLQAASGSPMVQFSLPTMLTLYNDPAMVARRMATAPARLFGIEGRGAIAVGNYADLVLVERHEWTVSDNDVLSLCGWTPMAGEVLSWRVVRTWINGEAPGISSMALRFK